MNWPCATESAERYSRRWDDPCTVCQHYACHRWRPCETCATNRRIDQLIGDDK